MSFRCLSHNDEKYENRFSRSESKIFSKMKKFLERGTPHIVAIDNLGEVDNGSIALTEKNHTYRKKPIPTFRATMFLRTTNPVRSRRRVNTLLGKSTWEELFPRKNNFANSEAHSSFSLTASLREARASHEKSTSWICFLFRLF